MINFKKYLAMNNKIRVSLASSDLLFNYVYCVSLRFFYFFYCVSVKMGNKKFYCVDVKT